MRQLSKACVMFTIGAAVMAPAVASAQQSMNFSIGGFNVRSQDARATDDVLVNNLSPFAFRIQDFDGVTVGAEYLVGLGDKFEAGLGAGFYQRGVPTVYNNFVNVNGTEIEQELKLRIVPLTATVRFLPLGHSGVEPYIGAGVGIFAFRYSESGQFLATDNTIFQDTFVGSGTATGPVVLGGIRIPVGAWGVGGEIRYQSAEGTLTNTNLFGSKIDLGGITYSFTIHVRF
jgi:outer membrane protein W